MGGGRGRDGGIGDGMEIRDVGHEGRGDREWQ